MDHQAYAQSFENSDRDLNQAIRTVYNDVTIKQDDPDRGIFCSYKAFDQQLLIIVNIEVPKRVAAYTCIRSGTCDEAAAR